MMHFPVRSFRFRAAMFLLAAILFASCARRSYEVLSVTSPLPKGVIDRTQPMQFTFSRRAVSADSLNQWTETPFIVFTPPIPGKFMWHDTAQLVFVPDAPPKGDQEYSARFNVPELLRSSGAKSFGGDETFGFSTERFRLATAEFFYDRIAETRMVGIRANLTFTYDVNPGDVAKTISATVNGVTQTQVRVVSPRAASVIAVELGEVLETDKEKTVAVQFDRSLVSVETNTQITMEKPFTFTLPPVAQLDITGHTTGFDGTTGWVTFSASQGLDTTGLRAFISLEPALPYSLESGENSFTMRGSFTAGTRLHIVLKKGLESYLHGKTQSDYEADILLGNVKPFVKFESPGGSVLLLSGRRKLGVKSMNTGRILVSVAQIFKNNLRFFLGQSPSYRYYYDEDEEEGYGYGYTRRRYAVGDYGRYIAHDTLRAGAATNKEQYSEIDLGEHLTPEHRGIYLVEIADLQKSWQTQSKMVCVSDIGMILKRSSDQVMVFTTSLATAAPLPGVAVKLISTNNQVIAEAVSDADGVARFDDYRKRAGDFQLLLVTADRGDDMNFIDLEANMVDKSRFDVGGLHDTPLQYDAMLYGDRNIYRPGEKVVIAGVIRQLHSAPPRGLPVKVRLTNPRGTVVSDLKLTLDDEGGFETSYQTSFGSLTGGYDVSLYTGNDVYLASTSVSVEDFVPDRMRVALTVSKKVAEPGDELKYDLTALNFFGPPASRRTVEFEGTLSHVPYLSKAFPEFTFADDAAKNYTDEPTVLKGETDGNGKASFSYTLPEKLTSTGLIRAKGRVAVFDETGRPVYQVAQSTIFPKPYLIGLRNMGDYYVKPNTDQILKVVALDHSDNPIRGFSARVALVRYEWHTVLRQSGSHGDYRYISERQPVTVWTKPIILGAGSTDFHYSVPRSGNYALRVSQEGDDGYNESSFYAYSWASENDLTSFPIDPEAKVQIVLNESTYAPGSRARVLFQTPFSGRMLVTVERNGVYQYKYIDVEGNSASLELPVEESYVPNVYVTATLFRKIQGSNIPLLAGHGFAPMFVEKPSNKLTVAILAPPKIRPRTKQTITVAVTGGANAHLTLAAVDEGICQVKNYRTPDPFGYFYQRKALETDSYDFFRYLLPEHVPAKGSAGGSDESISKRVNPLGVQRFKPVALWSGIVKVKNDGKAAIPFDIPDFNGELRLMAFVYKGDRFGSAEQAMKVSDPVILSPALPRFAAPNDSMIMPVTAFNTTDKPVKLSLVVSTTGPIAAGQKTASIQIAPNQETYVDIPLRTSADVGKAVVKITANAFGDNLESVTELPVRPIAPYVSTAIVGVSEESKPASFTVPKDFLPATRRSYLTLSNFPAVNFAKELKHLIGYPYGCIEQTVSKAFPQIYLRDMALLMDPSILNHGSPAYFVNEAVNKVVSMQLPDGTFAYWQGGTDGAPWATTYVTHFLLEAKRAGYAVPENILNKALNRLAPIARSRTTYDYRVYGTGNKVTVRRIADKNTLYALYVLAVAGKPDRGAMDFYRTDRSLLTRDAMYMLSAAYNFAGDKRAALAVMPPKFEPEENERESGLNFDSPIRAGAIMLNMMLETDPENPDIPVCVDYLSRKYRSDYWFSTQDDAFTLLAMGKMARAARGSAAQGTVTAGKQTFHYGGGDKRIDFDAFGSAVKVAVKGAGKVYYSLVTEGVSLSTPIKIEDRNLKVRREYCDRNGNPVSASSIKRNDLLIVRITLTTDNPIDYLAVSDLLPAGLEIENPRLSEQTNYAFIKDPADPSYTDIRDDRINFFFNHLGRGTEKLYYLVRAVSAGTFVQPAITAEAMYNGLYYSGSGGGRVRIAK